ncbi:M16 family metallopeptidase [Microscilla marina]|uniref:Peptidase, M16 family n=1 Tax=Microscilla marina ATCC 23134 TaxID=313606 RepID=A1ZLP0_MICM2|nr:pitrilysin family protein [Microscilla marina]EAY28794.1 peptidase, M16 family [Microscilla marina ATCC 23134]
MIDYQYFTLKNGLQVYLHQDTTTPVAAVNILYNVGSKDEDESKTGFAHLFEHLMFGGSKNIPSYDEPLQRVGGENNAYTTPDITNYYITLPTANIETAFWLESDRMMSLSFDPEVLEVQRKVVIEEFKQRYLNQPYGDVWLKLRPLAYQVHPYRWATIGKDISHIERATMQDVKDFFRKFYLPNNAILAVAGNIDKAQLQYLAEKWFGDIPAGTDYQRKLPKEPKQTEPRYTEVTGDVPMNALYKVYHMVSKSHPDYYATDLLSDVLGRGKSSRLYTRLVKEKNIFNSVNAYITGSVEPGLLVVHGNLNEGVSLEEGDEAVQKIITELKNHKIQEQELSKVKNQAESTLVFSEVEVLTRIMNLSFAALLGNANAVNNESEKIQAVHAQQMMDIANQILVPENSSTLYYRKA